MSKVASTSIRFFFLIIISFTVTITSTLTIVAVSGDPNVKQEFYGCIRIGPTVRCDPMPNKFDSLELLAHTQPMATINQTKFEPVEGVFGNALPIYGYSKQQYFTVPDSGNIAPPFSQFHFG